MTRPRQLRLFCNVCNGKGKVTYLNYQQMIVTVNCPKCKLKK
jgi:hypothetical protein